jgi:hypothetical protein
LGGVAMKTGGVMKETTVSIEITEKTIGNSTYIERKTKREIPIEQLEKILYVPREVILKGINDYQKS